MSPRYNRDYIQKEIANIDKRIRELEEKKIVYVNLLKEYDKDESNS